MLYGWWHPRELLRIRGLLDEESSVFSRPEMLLRDAVLAAQDRDDRTAALFDSDQEDDEDSYGYGLSHSCRRMEMLTIISRFH